MVDYLYHLEQLENWLATQANFRCTLVLSEPAEEDHWQGATGWVMDAVMQAYPDLSGHDLYMSGPPIMINAARTGFLEHGLPEQHMFSDAFEYAADTKDKTSSTP